MGFSTIRKSNVQVIHSNADEVHGDVYPRHRSVLDDVGKVQSADLQVFNLRFQEGYSRLSEGPWIEF